MINYELDSRGYATGFEIEGGILPHGNFTTCPPIAGQRFIGGEWKVLADSGIYEDAPPTYQERRAAKFPSIQEQLDMQYWDLVNGTTAWQDLISGIKEEIPKE